MARAERLEIISRIEKQRDSRVICYLTADRPANVNITGMNVALSSDVQPWLIQHLQGIGKVEHIDLFLYTRGGSTDAVWPIVSSIREYCQTFSVLGRSGHIALGP